MQGATFRNGGDYLCNTHTSLMVSLSNHALTICNRIALDVKRCYKAAQTLKWRTLANLPPPFYRVAEQFPRRRFAETLIMEQ
ncbi:hypothetical protein FHS21_001651 [Phyllobacterium trifolii]|uniref:Uncharacterized protein n=1 Tax=Phyllobacterium trifolii TaxID=300193 RepID=A0A839U2L3_9HYPH|nr:hypothetical protein [Phyllobacterium trifolii]